MMRYRPKVLKSGSNPRRTRHFLDNVVEFALVVQAEEYIIFLYHVPLRVRWPALQAEETSSTLVHGTIFGFVTQQARALPLKQRHPGSIPGKPTIILSFSLYIEYIELGHHFTAVVARAYLGIMTL